MTVSSCCKAPVRPRESDDAAATSFYDCSKCGKPCGGEDATTLPPINIIVTAPKGFRCFCPATNGMFYPEELQGMGIYIDADGKLGQLPDKTLPADVGSLDNLIVLWRTGQQATDGSPIYEGDFAELDIDAGIGLVKRIAIMRFVPASNQFTFCFNGKTTFDGAVKTVGVRLIGNEFQDKEASNRYHLDNE